MAKTTSHTFLSRSIAKKIMADLPPQLRKTEEFVDDKAIAGWFMGTSGENLDTVKELVGRVLELTLVGRKDLFPDDPGYITDDIKESAPYKDAIGDVDHKCQRLVKVLTKYSIPFSSLRYQGHMTWDITLPSLLGYIAGMLHNQNNVTPQAAPATILYEILACNDISRMAGFTVRPIEDQGDSEETYAWSHISCDGTVANIESVWAARELKFMPLGIRYAMEEGQPLHKIQNDLTLPDGTTLQQASAWQLLNLQQDDILSLPAQIAKLMEGEKDEPSIWTLLGEEFSLNAKGMNFFFQRYLAPENIKAPAIIVPSTKHYSWVKSTSLLGMGGGQKGLTEEQLTDISAIGDDGLINVYVDAEGKVKTELLKKVLETCKENKKPVVMNIAVVGTTEEGAVDPVEEILEIREEFRSQSEPFEYSVHSDAAWGGYFLSCIRKPFEIQNFGEKEPKLSRKEMFDNNNSWFRDSVYRSMSHVHLCDSVTIDPHKMGYIPYPAGSLTYRNDKIINLLSFSAPYISSEGSGDEINTRNIGESGIEGSKPGAAATAVFLSHQVIRPDKRGYGKIINQTMLNAKLLYLYLITLGVQYPDDKFKIVMLNPPPEEIKRNREHLAKLLWDRQVWGKGLFSNKDVAGLLKSIAGDQNIVDYVFVDKEDRSLDRTNTLNNDIFNAMSVQPGEEVNRDQIFVSKTTFERSNYGDEFIDALAARLSLGQKTVEEIPCIRSVVLDPWAMYTHNKGREGIFNFFTDIFLERLRITVNELCE